jgi:hypothetical protein
LVALRPTPEVVPVIRTAPGAPPALGLLLLLELVTLLTMEPDVRRATT